MIQKIHELYGYLCALISFIDKHEFWFFISIPLAVFIVILLARDYLPNTLKTTEGCLGCSGCLMLFSPLLLLGIFTLAIAFLLEAIKKPLLKWFFVKRRIKKMGVASSDDFFKNVEVDEDGKKEIHGILDEMVKKGEIESELFVKETQNRKWWQVWKPTELERIYKTKGEAAIGNNVDSVELEIPETDSISPDKSLMTKNTYNSPEFEYPEKVDEQYEIVDEYIEPDVAVPKKQKSKDNNIRTLGQAISERNTNSASQTKSSFDVCPACGAALRVNSKFCTKCGNKM